MPHTRPPLCYPYPRLLYRVLTDLHSWADTLRVLPEYRVGVEALLVRFWGLDQAVTRGILRRYEFHWSLRGHLDRVRLVPTAAHRRSPGIREIKQLFQEYPLDRVPRDRDKNTPPPRD